MKLSNEYIIKISVNADKAIGYIAEVLQQRLQEIANIELNIATDSNNYEYEIIVGNANGGIIDLAALQQLKTDGYVYKIDKNKVQICGYSSRGVIYGVYAFLEQELGCRYFAVDCIKIPKNSSIELDSKQVLSNPAFIQRDIVDKSSMQPDFANMTGRNGVYDNLQEKHGGFFEIGGMFCHSLPVIFDHKIYFDQHPEYYALIDGKRKRHPSQMCFTNPDLVEIGVNKILEWKRSRPDLKIFTISQADGYHFCTCDKCKNAYETYQAKSATLIMFINEVSRRVALHYPDVIIDTLAYLHNRKPPVGLKLEANVMIRLCSIECGQMYPLGSSDFMSLIYFENEKSYAPEQFIQDEKNWSLLTDKLFVWDYPVNTVHTSLPYPNFYTIPLNMQLHKSNNVKGVFVNASFLAQHSSFAGLRVYLYSKCMWNPNCDYDKHFNEFIDNYYGNAACKIKEFISYMQQRLNTKTLDMHFCSNINEWYDDEFISVYHKLLTQAEQLAENEEILQRVKREHLFKDIYELIRMPSTNADFDTKLEDFFDKAHSLGITVFRECEPRLSEKLYRYMLRSKDWMFDEFDKFAEENS